MTIDATLIDAGLINDLELIRQLIKEFNWYVKRGQGEEATIRVQKLKETCLSATEQMDVFLSTEHTESDIIRDVEKVTTLGS